MNKEYKIKNADYKEEYYTKLKDAILFDTRLNANDKILLTFYYKVSINKNYSRYSINIISKILNISEKTIRTINKKLKTLKYIDIIKSKNKIKPDYIKINKIKNINGFEIIKKIIKDLTFKEVKEGEKLPHGSGKNYRTGAVKITDKEIESRKRNNKLLNIEKETIKDSYLNKTETEIETENKDFTEYFENIKQKMKLNTL